MPLSIDCFSGCYLVCTSTGFNRRQVFARRQYTSYMMEKFIFGLSEEAMESRVALITYPFWCLIEVQWLCIEKFCLFTTSVIVRRRHTLPGHRQEKIYNHMFPNILYDYREKGKLCRSPNVRVSCRTRTWSRIIRRGCTDWYIRWIIHSVIRF